MVALNSQAERDALGIDSLERALVYGFLNLRAVILDQDNSGVADQKIKIGEKINHINDSTLVLEGKFNYNSFLVSRGGGKIIPYLQEISNKAMYSPIFASSPSQIINPKIPETPNNIATLEQYILWSAFILLASAEEEQSFINIQKLEHNREGSYLLLKINLPFDYQSYLLGKSYIDTVQRIVSSYKAFSSLGNPLLENSSLIDNSFSFSN